MDVQKNTYIDDGNSYITVCSKCGRKWQLKRDIKVINGGLFEKNVKRISYYCPVCGKHNTPKEIVL